MVGMMAHAQLQRSIIDPSFEDPFTGTRAVPYNTYFATAVDWVFMDQGEVPGWNTTSATFTNVCPAGNGPVTAAPYNVAPYTCAPIELWFNNFNGVVPAQGKVLAELNANSASKLYQSICLTNGESFTFNFAHRGRQGVDSARFEASGTAPIMTFQTGNTNGVVGAVTAVAAGTTGASAVSIANGWTRYSGTYTYTGATGLQPLGFIAVSSAGGNLSVGNLLDDLNINLKPYAELTTSTFSVEGSPMAQTPKLRFVGAVTAAMPMTLTFSSPSAVYLSDYDFGGTSTLAGLVVSYNAATQSGTLTFNIPIGNYGFDKNNTDFVLPLRVLDDTAIENNEVISFNMPSSMAYPYLVGNTMACGGTATTLMTHTIIDNDVSLRTSKSVSASTTTLGGTLSYTVSFANVTPAVLTVAPLTAHDVVGVSLSDAVPAGMGFSSWTCSASGAALCPAASGTGAIASTATIPAGGSLLFSITAPVSSAVGNCAATIVNTATQALSATSMQPVNGSFPIGTLAVASTLQGSAGFVVQPLSANASSQVVACTSLGISKTNGVSSLVAGSTTSYTITAFNNGPFAGDGARVLDQPTAGLSCTAASCAVASGSALCPVLSSSAMATALLTAPGLAIASFPANSSLSFSLQCSVTATGQ